MWYFAWILGLSLAVLLAVVSAMMLDARECKDASNTPPAP